MKAVILAAGEGKRMRPLTYTTPKPLLRVNNQPILKHILDYFPEEIDEVIVVVKYLGDQIKQYIGTQHRHMNIRYVIGSNKGSAQSFLASKRHLKNERLLVIQGDDIPHPVDIKKCLSKDLSMLVFKPRDPSVCGMAHFRKDGSISRIVEKPKSTKSKVAIDGLMVLNTDIFNYRPLLSRGEFYFSSMAGLFARDNKVFPVETAGFIGDITSPSDLVRAGNLLKERSG